jgi:hypothetical protein
VLRRGQSSDKAAPRIWSPNEILGADVFPEIMQAIFRENERGRVRVTLEAEQKRLKEFVEKGRLQVHFDRLTRAVRDRVRRDADRAGDEAAQDVSDQRKLALSGEEVTR